MGGDVDQLKQYSPIEKVSKYFLIKDFGKFTTDKEDISLNHHSKIANKTMKRLKDFEKIGNSLLKIKRCFQNSSENSEAVDLKTSSKMLLRRCLVEKLSLVTDIIKREKLRMELLKLN